MIKIIASSRQLTSGLKVVGIILLATLQITFMPLLSIYGVWPNLILLLALVLIFLNDIPKAFLVASLGGLILDLASPLMFGFYSLLILAIIYLVKTLFNKYLSDAPLFAIAIITALSVIVFDSVLNAVSHQFFGLKIVTDIIYSIVIVLGLYQILCYQRNRFQFLKIRNN